jgi:hypothetical protein
MSGELRKMWTEAARSALGWREGEPIAPVLEALALSVALELMGELPAMPAKLREELRRIGQRALLHAGAEPPDDEDAEDALRLAVALARDGLRALAGRAPDAEPAGPPPSPREIARLLGGRVDAFQAAWIARRARASEAAREEIAWAMRRRRAAGATPVRLAAADGEALRDPAEGQRIATIVDPRTGAEVAEAYAFPNGTIAVYADSGAVVRLESEAVCTEIMQPGYWLGRRVGESAEGPIEGTLHVGDNAYPFRA